MIPSLRSSASPYLAATSGRERGANGRASECVQRKVKADDSGCSVLRDVEPISVERVHRENVAVRSVPLWRGPSAVVSLAEIVSDMESSSRETAADPSAARQLGDVGR